MKVCLLGAQGTGKTTLVNHFKDQYKVIDGIARNVLSSGGKGNKDGNVESQKRIFDDYYTAMSTNDEFISTRSVIDVVAYTQYLYQHEKDLFKKLRLWFEYKRQLCKTKKWLKNNPNVAICFIPISPISSSIENDGVRSTDEDYQLEISILMFKLLNDLSFRQKWVIDELSLETRTDKLEKIIKIVKSQDQFYAS